MAFVKVFALTNLFHILPQKLNTLLFKAFILFVSYAILELYPI